MHILAEIGVDNVFLVGKWMPCIRKLMPSNFDPMATSRPATLRDAYEFPFLISPVQELRIKYPDGTIVYGMLVCGEGPEADLYLKRPKPAKMERKHG